MIRQIQFEEYSTIQTFDLVLSKMSMFQKAKKKKAEYELYSRLKGLDTWQENPVCAP